MSRSPIFLLLLPLEAMKSLKLSRMAWPFAQPLRLLQTLKALALPAPLEPLARLVLLD